MPVSLTRTNWRSLGTIQKVMLFRKLEDTGWKSTFSFFGI
jgi:hypothetical protein